MSQINTPLMQEPASCQISFRLSALVSQYGSEAVHGQIVKFKNPRAVVRLSPENSPQVHVSNLIHTYGHEAVMGLFESIWPIPKAS